MAVLSVFAETERQWEGQRCGNVGDIWSESHGELLTSEDWAWPTLQRQKGGDRESVSELWQMSAQLKSSPSGCCPTSALWTMWRERSIYESSGWNMHTQICFFLFVCLFVFYPVNCVRVLWWARCQVVASPTSPKAHPHPQTSHMLISHVELLNSMTPPPLSVPREGMFCLFLPWTYGR